MAILSFSRLILLMSCLLTGQVMADSGSQDSGDTCGTVPRFLRFLNGDYNNKVEVQKGNFGAQYVRDIFLPVSVPALNASYAFVFVEILNGGISRLDVRVPTEESPGVVRVTGYNVTNQSYIKLPPELFNVDFSTLQPGDIHLYTTCTARFEAARDDSFVGGWDVCTGPAIRSHYGVTVRCDDFYADVPADAPEAPIYEPYYLVRNGSRFPVPNAPASCARVCADKK